MQTSTTKTGRITEVFATLPGRAGCYKIGQYAANGSALGPRYNAMATPEMACLPAKVETHIRALNTPAACRQWIIELAENAIAERRQEAA